MRSNARRLRWADEQPIDIAQKIVADRAGDGPIRRQRLVLGQDFFGDDIERPGRQGVFPFDAGGGEPIGQPLRAGLTVRGRLFSRHRRRLSGDEFFLQLMEITDRIAEAVRMIDAQSRRLAFDEQTKRDFVGRPKNVGPFHPDRGQIVDVEEPAIVDFLAGHAPISRAIRLGVDQAVHRIEAGRFAGRAVVFGDRGVQGGAKFRASDVQSRDSPFDNFLLAIALGQLIRIGFGARRQVVNLRQDAQQFLNVLVLLAELRRQFLPPSAQDVIVGSRSNRQLDQPGER